MATNPCRYILKQEGVAEKDWPVFKSKEALATHLNKTPTLVEALKSDQFGEVNEMITSPTGFEDIDNANTAESLSKLYREEQRQPTAIDFVDQTIADHISGDINRESYSRFGDINNVGSSMAKTYFAAAGQKGRTIDQVAAEASNTLGKEITPDEVASFMERYPNGFNAQGQRDNKRLKIIGDKYKELTGKNLNKTAAQSILEKAAEGNEKELESANELAQKFFDAHEGDEAAFIASLEDEGFWTIFPHGYSKEEFNQVKELIKSQQDGNATTTGTEVPGTNENGENSGQNDGESSGKSSGEKSSEGAEPPVSEPPKESTEGGEEKKKKVFARITEDTNPERVKSTIEDLGLSYKVAKHKNSEATAESFIKKVGVKSAIDAVENYEIAPAPSAFVLGKAINDIGKALSSTEISEDERSELEALERRALNILELRARGGGQFISALSEVYSDSDLGFSLGKMVERYESVTGTPISPEVKEKFAEYDKQLKEVNAKLAEAEKRATEAEEKAAVENIVEDLTRQKKAPSAKDISQKLAAKVRQAKITRPNVFNSSSPAIAIWDGAVEVVATAIEAGGSMTEAIKKGVQYIKDSEWYKGITEDLQKEAEKEFKKAHNDLRPQIEVTDGKVKVPVSIIRELVAGGVTNIDDLSQAVLDEIKADNPDLTVREVRDAITGYGRTINPTKDQLRLKINELKRIGALESKLEDLQAKIVREKNPKTKAQLSEQEKDLREQIKRATAELPIDEAARTASAKENVKKKIAELEARIKNQDFSKKVRRPVIEDTELVRLNAEKQKVQDAYMKDLYGAELKARGPRKKFLDGAAEVWGLTRSLMATGEMSFIAIQGGLQSIAHPKHAVRALWKSVQHGWSEKKAQAWGEFIKAQPFYPQMKKSKLALSEYDARLEAREEQFLGGWVNKIWDFIGLPIKPISEKAYEAWKKVNPVKAIERAGVGYMNTLRILRYLDGMYILEQDGKTFEDNPQDFKNMADAINTMTGRASLGPLEDSRNIKKILPLLFFSPRNWLSMLKTTTPLAFYHFGKMGYKDGKWKPSAAQKMALSDHMKYLSVTVGMLSLAAMYLNDDDDDETEVETDPRSSDFGTIRLGDTRIDVFGGRKQQVVFQSRLIMDALGKQAMKSTTTGNLTYLGEGMTPSKAGLAWRMMKNKLAPSAGILARYMESNIDPKTGKRKGEFGVEYNPSDDIIANLYPMYWGTVDELWKEQPETVASFLTAMAFIGVGVSTYGGLTEQSVQKEYEKLYKEYGEKHKKAPTDEQNKKLIDKAYQNELDKEESNKEKRRLNDKFSEEMATKEYKKLHKWAKDKLNREPNEDEIERIVEYSKKMDKEEPADEKEEKKREKDAKEYIEKIVSEK